MLERHLKLQMVVSEEITKLSKAAAAYHLYLTCSKEPEVVSGAALQVGRNRIRRDQPGLKDYYC
jgi:hypothetical protein